MTTKMWKKSAFKLDIGQVVVGKWHKNVYQVQKKLGEGAIGAVYLCSSKGRLVALKGSDQTASIMSEVNRLKALKRGQGHSLGPAFIDVDDLEDSRGVCYSFYAMEYIDGISLDNFIRIRGFDWLDPFIHQFSNQLSHLHQAGWVLGDIKIENILVTKKPHRLRWIDVGGMTEIGRSMKEYSEFYDRAYWHLGSRRAEPSYDIFAFAMVIIRLYYPKGFERSDHPKKKLLEKINQAPVPEYRKQLLKHMVQGDFKQMGEVKDMILNLPTQQTRRSQSSRTNAKRKNSTYSKDIQPHYPWLEVSSIVGWLLITSYLNLTF
ncbi:protein kinase domain-containing protein [Saliterribacillus persicus]|uniref:Serine/threonine-protein kinase n=1 Tax=Saliterribacillus persicus TaxID=930114 RepID=A0A368X518_9BACI|nr:serine/threonine protein kinase [Saliterribacillus persicus]RCW63033.1 serine/threonine-protein kinase [Saliterribacillus persicus]